MDTDPPPPPHSPAATAMDTDPTPADPSPDSLLHQFSCMATTDRDVLVSQLQKMVGENVLNPTAAAFFLDMNNWNLQLAVGSYFDLIGSPTNQHQHQTSTATRPAPPLAAIIGSTPSFSCTCSSSPHRLTIPHSAMVGVRVTLENDGGGRWEPNSLLRFVQGDANLMVNCDNSRTCDWVGVGGVEPSATTNLDLTLLCPPHLPLSTVCMHWQMCTPDGYLFGKLITFEVTIDDGGGGEVVQHVVDKFGELFK